MKLEGQRLRAKLDQSANERQTFRQQRQHDAAHEQQDRQRDNAARAAQQQHNAQQTQAQLRQMAHRRATDSSINRVERAMNKAELQHATQTTLQTLSHNRQHEGVQRANARQQARQRLGEDTAMLLGDAAGARQELRQDLNEFAAAIHGRSERFSFAELEPRKAVVKPRAVAKSQAKPQANKPIANTTQNAPERGFSPTIGAMHNPEPMTAIVRRREQVLIKTIAANPGIRAEQLESSLVLERSEVQRLLKQLVAQHRLLVQNGGYVIATLQPA
jgi:hypothetical protein